jgi:NADH-quinone oxidoreductase subunit M
MLLGELRYPDAPGTPRPFPDLRARELAAVVPLLVLATVIGLVPRFLLDLVEPAARTVNELVAR